MVIPGPGINAGFTTSNTSKIPVGSEEPVSPEAPVEPSSQKPIDLSPLAGPHVVGYNKPLIHVNASPQIIPGSPEAPVSPKAPVSPISSSKSSQSHG